MSETNGNLKVANSIWTAVVASLAVIAVMGGIMLAVTSPLTIRVATLEVEVSKKSDEIASLKTAVSTLSEKNVGAVTALGLGKETQAKIDEYQQKQLDELRDMCKEQRCSKK